MQARGYQSVLFNPMSLISPLIIYPASSLRHYLPFFMFLTKLNRKKNIIQRGYNPYSLVVFTECQFVCFFSFLRICCAQSRLTLCDLWTVACQAPLSLGFSRQEYERVLFLLGNIGDKCNLGRESCLRKSKENQRNFWGFSL